MQEAFTWQTVQSVQQTYNPDLDSGQLHAKKKMIPL